MMKPSVLAETLSRISSHGTFSGYFPGADRCRVIQGGDHLFRAGEHNQDAYLIRSGNLKRYTVYPNGEEQILGLHGPGDVVGFHVLFDIPAQCSVVALDTAHVQVLPLLRKSLLDADGAGNAQVAVQAMYQELLRLSRLLYIERHPTERRLAEYLLDFSEHQRLLGLSRDQLVLPLIRRDLARFLGLAPETLSRTLSRFHSLGLIEIDNREISITDRQGLETLAEG